MNETLTLTRDWKPLRYQLSDTEGKTVFVDGIGKMGLGIHSDSFEENGETITDYLITHVRSGHNLIDRLHCFNSQHNAKKLCDELWEAGANFRVGEQGVKSQRDIIYPRLRMYIDQCEAAWAGIPEGTMLVTIVERTARRN